MVFVFDLDDTIIDTDGYSEKYISKFIKEHNLPYKLISKVARFAEKKFDWDMEAALCWYKEYGDNMMLEFPCKENAKEIINNLYDCGHTIIIATARATDWHKDPENITIKWLENNEIKYHKAYIGRVDKEKICEEECADVFLDDDIKIVQRVSEYFNCCNNSGKAILFNTEYNRELSVSDSVMRVNDFMEFIEIVEKLD